MDELKRNENLPVQATTNDNVLTVRFNQSVSQNDLNVFANQMQEMIEKLQANNDHNSEKTMNEIKDVKKTIKSKHISPQDLDTLESLVDKKARKYVDKNKGIQLSIDVLLNYDAEGLKEFQKLVNTEYGRTKQRIWVELNKECLERKGTAPKKRILDTQVERAFDFVRKWGGFSV